MTFNIGVQPFILKDSETFRLYYLGSLRHFEFDFKLNVINITETFSIYHKDTEIFKLYYWKSLYGKEDLWDNQNLLIKDLIIWDDEKLLSETIKIYVSKFLI